VDDIEGLASRLDGIRDPLHEVRPILAARRSYLGPLLTSLGQDVFEDLRPPLTGRALAEFESTHAVGPPADYRAFPTEVGNGGPGPGFGMPELRPPFPQTALAPRRPPPPGEVNQLVSIAILGCGQVRGPVVAGPDAGDVWFFDMDGVAPSAPRSRSVDWYEGWLKETLRLGEVAPGPLRPDDDA
jgi:hypothetical protein